MAIPSVAVPAIGNETINVDFPSSSALYPIMVKDGIISIAWLQIVRLQSLLKKSSVSIQKGEQERERESE